MKVFFAALVATSLALAGCSSSSKKSTNVANSGQLDLKRQNLTEAQAMSRSKVLSNIHYNLHIHLDKKSDEFKGQEQVEFDLSEVPSELHLDFFGGRIAQYSVNNRDIENIEHTDGVLKIPTKYLRKGSNHVVVHYAQKYSNNSRGFYRFEDKEDKRVYLYTHFEPFDANHFLPSFDQPDLKATMRMTVTAPSDWVVVTTTLEENVQSNERKQLKTWTFQETPKMSTYLFSLHAGPYYVWKSKAGKVPLRLFARQSLAKYVKPDFWFKITKQGLEFYDSYFAYPYPFKKYDQVIVPDFNSGAMENIAAVTFSERYIVRGEATKDHLESLANVLLHEMAHMWFGNLVTMKWWNGLWLNESFATYMAYVAVARVTEFKDTAWMSFNSGDKSWAYMEDQSVTTHPINGKVPDIESTFNNFDGITYGKGAAALKELAYYLGDDTFRDGLRNYFKKYEYQNTTLQDFIGSLASVSGKDLDEWSDQWLERKGVDALAASFKCEESEGVSKIKEIDLNMTPSKAQSASRVHATEVGLFDKVNNQLVQRKSVRVEYSKGQTELISLVGEKCPDFVYPNVNDYDYVKVNLDSESLAAAKNHIADIKDNLTRMMVWSDLYEMLRDRKLAVNEYLSLLLKNLPKEKDTKMMTEILYNLPSVAYYLPKSTEEQKTARTKSIGELEKMCLNGFLNSRPGSDDQKTWFDSLVRIAETPEALAKLTDVLKGRLTAPGFKLDQDRRWSVVIRLMAFNAAGSEQLLAKEKQRDTSENGLKASLSAEAARPDPQQKFTMLNQVIAPSNDMSIARRKSIVRYAFPINQDEFRQQYRDEFYKNLLQMVKEGRDSQILRLYSNVTPVTCDEQSLKKIDSFLSKNSSKLVPTVLKTLKVAKQEEERCIEIRKRAVLSEPPKA